jgi:class 3 adenylate cyclase/PAS domain-containing protein
MGGFVSVQSTDTKYIVRHSAPSNRRIIVVGEKKDKPDNQTHSRNVSSSLTDTDARNELMSPKPPKWQSIRNFGNDEKKFVSYKSSVNIDSNNSDIVAPINKLIRRASVHNTVNKQFNWDQMFGFFTDGVVIINNLGTIQYANETTHEMFEFDSLDSRDIRLLIPDNRNNFRNIPVLKTSDDNREIKHYREYQTQTRLGNTIYVQFSFGKYQINPLDKYYGFLITFRNITDNKLLEQKWLQEFQRNEALISSLLPPKIVMRIRNGEENIHDKHACVSVGFCDIKQFTTLCNQKSTEEIIEMLNTLFTKFDQIAKIHNVTKIETIGDCYMIACGLFGENTHAERAIWFMHDAIKFALSIGIEMRAGIDSGPVSSGVIGVDLPHFSLFGRTVNRASRMESNGTPGKIHVTQEVVNIIDKKKFKTTSDGSHDLKGFGQINTFLIEPI